MTLVEVMVASALLALFIAAAIGVLMQIASASELVRRRTSAVALAWSRLERARHIAFDDIINLIEAPPGNVVDETGSPDVDGLFRRATSVQLSTNGLPMKHIRAEIWVRDRRTGEFAEHPEILETVIVDIPRKGE